MRKTLNILSSQQICVNTYICLHARPWEVTFILQSKRSEKRDKKQTIYSHHVVKTLHTSHRVIFHSQVEGTHTALVFKEGEEK